MDHPEVNGIHINGDEEIIEVIDLNDTEPHPDDLADELGDVEFEDPGNANDAVLETEDEMEAEAVQDDSELTFSKHTGSVFCVNLDPVSNSLAVTGGEDDKAYVWRVCDGEVLFECAGHKDSVTCAVFSYDSSLVATGDLCGLIKAWNVHTKEEIWSFEVADLEWLEWHPRAPVLLAGADDGNMWMWKIPSGECKVFGGSAYQSTYGKVLPDGKRAVVGYEDGAVRVWDLKQGNIIHVVVSGPEGHEGAVTSMAYNKDGSLVLTGSVDGFAKLISTITGKVVGSFCVDPVKARDDEEETNCVESVGFCNTLPLIAVAYLHGTLEIYDLSAKVLRHRCQHEAGLVHLQWEESSSVLVTCCLGGAVQLWDPLSGVIVSEYCGHSAEILDFAINREASIVVTASGDKEAKVFCLQRPDR